MYIKTHASLTHPASVLSGQQSLAASGPSRRSAANVAVGQLFENSIDRPHDAQWRRFCAASARGRDPLLCEAGPATWCRWALPRVGDIILRSRSSAQVQWPQHDPTTAHDATQQEATYVAKNVFSRHKWSRGDQVRRLVEFGALRTPCRLHAASHLCRQKRNFAT
jgi:hypothetical protein